MARRRRLTPAQPGYSVSAEAAPSPAPGAARAAPIAQVTGQSAEAAALREMADGIQAARDEGRMIVDVPLSDVSPSFLIRDRIVLDREELDALKASIRDHGQRVPAEITPLPAPARAGDVDEASGMAAHRFGLISGWRRLTALNELHGETGQARFSTLRALIRAPERAVDSYVAMVEENEIRVGLSYYERARVVAELTRRGVFPDQPAALRTLFAGASRAKRSKIGSFVDLVEALDGDLRFPTEIPERLGLALVARLRAEGAGALRPALRRGAPATPEAELALLEKLVRPRRPAPVSHTAQMAERLGSGVSMVAQRKKDRITVTLSGAAVDEALLQKVRKALRDLD